MLSDCILGYKDDRKDRLTSRQCEANGFWEEGLGFSRSKPIKTGHVCVGCRARYYATLAAPRYGPQQIQDLIQGLLGATLGFIKAYSNFLWLMRGEGGEKGRGGRGSPMK